MPVEPSNSTDLQKAAIASLYERMASFHAPYLEEKLHASGAITDHETYEEVFREWKKYVALCSVTGGHFAMRSRTVDALWHQFILFTSEYQEFCANYLPTFFHHRPNTTATPMPEGADQAFVREYESTFGPLAAVWHVGAATRGKRQRPATSGGNGMYPTRDEHAERWERLAREIAASKKHLQENGAPCDTAPKGTLIVIGSGIEGVDFTMSAEPHLRTADKVFYCVANAVTRVWLHTLRPDAYDLSVLYDDTKRRYFTYVQMTEAMLHYVRQGLRVVVAFYGHPGMLVFSSHRAVAIARLEGHYAVMKPGISALDCLCADLGVDPGVPGLQTLEATDALIRNYPLDTGMHVVLWQVGLVGEPGYRRKGFINDKFPLLVEYLAGLYGQDHEITHYIAARYPGFDPVIAVHRIDRLTTPRIRATLKAASTFYIPPKDAVPANAEMAVRLGLLRSRKPEDVEAGRRQSAFYAPAELAAIDEFDHFRVPAEYQFLERTRAAEFLIELGRNVALQELYREAPAQAVSDESFPGLSAVERHLLTARDANRAQIAANGALSSPSPDERFVIDVHRRQDLAGGFRKALASEYRRENFAAALDSWIASQGYRTTLARLPAATHVVNASMLLPWTGVYSTPDGGMVLTVIGNPDSNRASLVYVDDTPLTGFTFHDRTLIWAAADGNPHNGELTFHMPAAGEQHALTRTVSGKCWAADAGEPSQPNRFAAEVVSACSQLSIWTGRYTTRVIENGSAGNDGPVIEVLTPRPNHHLTKAPRLLVDGRPVEGARFDRRTIRWADNQITFAQDGENSGRLLLSGQLDGYEIAGASVADHHAPFEGVYRAYSWSKDRWDPCGEVHYDGRSIRLGDRTLQGAIFDRNSLHWSGADGQASSGRLRFFIDPVTQLPKFIGSVWNSGQGPEHPNFFGILAFDAEAGLRLEPPPGAGGSVSPRVWQALAAISLQGSDPACHLLWSRWQRARFTCHLLNHVLPTILGRGEASLEEKRKESNDHDSAT